MSSDLAQHTSAETAPQQRSVRRVGRRNWAGAVVSYAILIVGALVTLGPFVLSIMTALKTPGQFASEPALSFPNPFTGQNFADLFGAEHNFIAPVAVTAQMVGVILVGQLLFSILAAYAFARIEFPGRNALFWVYLSTLMVPQVVTVIPLYVIFSEVGMRNTFWSLVLPFVFGSPYAVFLLREYFKAIPQEVIDAARLDGAGTLRVLFAIVVPLSKPIIITLTIITVVTQWNSFLWPLIITTGKTWQTMTVATAGLQSQYNGNWTLVMAGTTIAVAPLLLLYALFQKRIVSSIAITSFR